MRRLRSTTTFQGARYEVFAAAMCCRAGLSIEWIHADASSKSPEFLARFEQTGEEFVVETKSMHRVGVLHSTTGSGTDDPERGTRAGRLFEEALGQGANWGKPLLIFLDVNLPAAQWRGPKEEQYGESIRAKWAERVRLGIERADSASVLMTNIGWYFHGREEAPPGGTTSLILPAARGQISEALMTRLMRSAQESGTVPDEEARRAQVRKAYPEFR